jgi:hypothetical protein
LLNNDTNLAAYAARKKEKGAEATFWVFEATDWVFEAT